MTSIDSDHRIRKVVIVGGGTAGWMAAAALGRYLNNGYTQVVLVESEEIGIVGVGEATIPPILTFNKMLGLNENEFLEAVHGTFKLGIEFVNWGRIGDRYFHPFGTHGHDVHGVRFHQLWLRERARRPVPDISNYCMSAVAAMHGKMARPGPGAQTSLREIQYAYHFDASLYGKFLRNYAEAAGVQRIEGKIVDAALDAGNGFVDSVQLESGQVIDGDLFIDCSGFRGLLIEQALQTGYDDWTHWLPCDRAFAVPCANPPALDPYTRATAHSAGWQWRIPLQHRTGNGHVYSSSFMSDQKAADILLANLDGEALDDPRQLRFTTGRRKLSWNRNVIAMGLSSGFIEPLESTSIHLIQTAIAWLIAVFPDRRFLAAERDEFNRIMREKYEDIRNFIVLHYSATERSDSEFWNYCRTMPVPDTLTEVLELWKAKGRSFREGYDLFGITSWVAVLLGQRIEPEGYDPIADAFDDGRIATAMEEMRQGYFQTAQAMPSQGEFLAQILTYHMPQPAPWNGAR
ncbi:tryptophan halogenase family protein [Sphingomonas sp.]|uniref:tryptophan halogenase family protein n=1 Tax=Sphingomonas sp. TaxID=28214 RepID=UPI001B0F0005|nr:tryptophan halogenase family protein [Sphingomonas sp.]MBO9713436.1 tryptophan 7-halogenase [Sphingomonas sp.]